MKNWVLQMLAKRKLARLLKQNEELVEHFADTLEVWQKASKPNNAQHKKMEQYIRTMLDNLRITSVYLAEQVRLMEDRHV